MRTIASARVSVVDMFLPVTRRHVDLLRVSTATCRG